MSLRDLALFLATALLAALVTAARAPLVVAAPAPRVHTYAPGGRVLYWSPPPRPWWYDPERDC